MASAGQAHAHSSQPMHFSSPSGHRLSWWWPWNRGAVGFLTSGYSTVSTLRNISWKVTPNPLTGLRRSLRKSSTCDLLTGGFRMTDDGFQAGPAVPADAVVVRQVHRRHREGRGAVRDLAGLGFFGGVLLGGVPRRPLLRGAVPHPDQAQDEHEDDAEDDVRGRAVGIQPPRAH